MSRQTTKTAFLKELLSSFLLFLLVAGMALMIFSPASAQDLSETLSTVGGGSKLPTFEEGHAQSSYEFGASNITTAIFFAVDLLKYILGTIAVVVIIASGVRLITAGKQIEDIATQQKENIKYALIGLLVIIMADVMVKQVFFGEAGEVYRGQAEAQAAAERGTEQIKGLYNFLEVFVGSIAILMIVISGFQMVASGGNEETMGKSKKHIMWAVIGLVVVGVSELVVKDIVFPAQGSQLPSAGKGQKLIVDITNFVSGFVATVAIAFYMYGGFLYVTAAGKEDQAGKAKKVLIGATIGLLLAMGAFALVNTFIKVEPLLEEAVSGQQPPAGETGVQI